MRYLHYIDVSLCLDRISLETTFHFGSPIISPEDDVTEGEYWGLGITLFIFELHLGIIAL